MFLFSDGFKMLKYQFPKWLDMIGSNEIGQYEFASLRFLAGFRIMITSAVFHAFGISFSRMQA
jgi:hypothetical protein